MNIQNDSVHTRACRKRRRRADSTLGGIEDQVPLALKVFGNDVIIRKLKEFVPLEDLKSLRQVCKTLNTAILWKTSFISDVQLVLNFQVFSHQCFYSLSFEPKHVKIVPFPLEDNNFRLLNFGIPERKVTRMVSKLVRNCESLTIWDKEDPDCPVGYNLEQYFREMASTSKDLDLDNLALPKHIPDILKVVSSGRKLLRLSLNQAAPYYLAGATQDQVKGLENLLEIEWNEWIPGAIECSFYCPRIFMELKGLKRLGFGGFDTIETYGWSPASLKSCERFKTVLRNNLDSLSDWGILVNLENYKYFELNSRKFYPTITKIRCGDFNQFIHQQLMAYRNNLEDLSLTCPESEQTMLKIVNDVTQPVPMPNLRKLRIHSLYHSNVRKFVDNFMQFFQNLKLEEFELRVGLDDESPLVEPLKDLLALVPNRNRLKRLRLSGQQLILKPVSTSLANFTSLTSLELEEVAGLTDEFIRSIFRHVKQLRKLLICAVYELTDAALLEPDVTEPLPTPLLGQLKYLEKLVLIDIPNMTKRVVREGIQSQTLHTLVLLDMILNLDADDINFLVARNPSLKSFRAELSLEQQSQVQLQFINRRNLRH